MDVLVPGIIKEVPCDVVLTVESHCQEKGLIRGWGLKKKKTNKQTKKPRTGWVFRSAVRRAEPRSGSIVVKSKRQLFCSADQ